MPLFNGKAKSPPVNPSGLNVIVQSAPPRPEEVYARQLGGAVVDRGSATLDKIDDTVNRMIKPFEHGTALYNTNKEVIDGALSAMATAAGAGTIIDDWIGPINKVLTGLEGLAKSQPFPGVELAVKLFNGVVTLEVQRRQNSVKARALILQMADMMSTLLELHFVKDPDMKTEDGQSVSGRMQNLLGDIKNDITTCGNVINKYHQHSTAAKFFLSGQYKDQFKNQADKLVAPKADIQFACTVHSTVTIDELRDQVRASNTMLLKLTSIIEYQSDREKSWEEETNRFGGPKRILDNPEALQSVARTIERSGPDLRNKVVAPEEGPGFDRKELLEVQQPLSKLLDDSRVYYERKLDAQIQYLASQIELSTQRILQHLDGGSWTKIIDPDIRAVWRANGWRTSVKNRQFVMALHDYYQDRYAAALAKTRRSNSLPNGYDDETDDDVDISPTAVSASADGAEREDTSAPNGHHTGSSDQSILDDKDYLQYLSIPYLRAVAEGFDDDGSGFVRIFEVNKFTSDKPDGWSLLQWIAFWARGWACECALYSCLLWSIYDGMGHQLNKTLAENSTIVHNYLIGQWSFDFEYLTRCAAIKSTTRTDTPLDNLVRAHMKITEDQLEASLENLFFTLDSPEAITLVLKSGRLGGVVSFDIFALFFVLLRRGVRLIALAQEQIMDERDFLEATKTLDNVTDAVWKCAQRMQKIAQGQGLEVERIASGVYEFEMNRQVPTAAKEPVLPDDMRDALWQELLPGGLDLKRYSNRDFSLALAACELVEAGKTGEVLLGDTVSQAGPKAVEGTLLGSAIALQPSFEPADPHTGSLSPVPDSSATVMKQDSAQDAVTCILAVNENGSKPKDAIEALYSALCSLAQYVSESRLFQGAQSLHRYIKLLKSLIDRLRTSQANLSLVSGKILDAVVTISTPLLQFSRLHKSETTPTLNDNCISRLGNLLGPLYLELACLQRHYLRHLEHEEAATKLAQGPGLLPTGAGNGVVAPSRPLEGTIPQTAGASTGLKQPGSELVEVPMHDDLQHAFSRVALHTSRIQTTVNLRDTSGVKRFSAAAQFVLSEIHEHRRKSSWGFLRQRRDLRKAFVGALVQKLAFDQAANIWPTESPPPGIDEVRALYQQLAEEISPTDEPMWTLLARWEYRRISVHLNHKCGKCAKLIFGPRYICLCCEQDICSDCCDLEPSPPLVDGGGRQHHISHPLVKIFRPMRPIHQEIFDEFTTKYALLQQDEHPSLLFKESGPNPAEDSRADVEAQAREDQQQLRDEAGLIPQVAQAPDPDSHDSERAGLAQQENMSTANPSPLPSQAILDGASRDDPGAFDLKSTLVETHQYRCSECKSIKTGMRWVTQQRYGFRQFCPTCEVKLAVPRDSKPLAPELHILLRLTLPTPIVKDTVIGDGKNTVEDPTQKLVEQVATLDTRLAAMESRIQSLESKLDLILTLLVPRNEGKGGTVTEGSQIEPAVSSAAGQTPSAGNASTDL